MLVTVAGAQGVTPSPLVMNPGRWAVSISVKKKLFLDYFVLLPEEFYEATKLAKKVENPCRVDNSHLCRQYSYPDLSNFDIVYGEGGFTSENDTRDGLTEYVEKNRQLNALKEVNIPLLNNEQQEIHLDLTVTRPGPYVLIINYMTPENDLRPHSITVQTSSQKDKNLGMAFLPACPYTTLCRQVVVEGQRRINVFNFDANFISVTLKVRRDVQFENIVL